MKRCDVLRILQELHHAAYGWAVHCCDGDRWDAEEVLHDVYLGLLEGKTSFRGDSQPKTWLFSMVRNQATQRRRRIRRRLRLLRERFLGTSSTAHAVAPDEQVRRREVRMRLGQLLAQLPPRQQQALHLVFYQDLSLQEAAEVMGVSVGAARVHYHRGKLALRRGLEEAGLDDAGFWKPSDSQVV